MVEIKNIVMIGIIVIIEVNIEMLHIAYVIQSISSLKRLL